MRITKYRTAVNIKITKGGRILSIRRETPNFFLYVLEDENEKERELRHIRFFQTEEQIQTAQCGHLIEFLGSFEGNGKIYHIFETSK